MAIILRFVDAHGFLREHFFQIVHVHDTTAATLKKEICDVLTRYNLEIHNIRGQEYDGASNMCGAFNGLQALFLKDCPYAYYVNCFSHRLQLALVAAAENEISIWLFFLNSTTIVNLVTSSSKRNVELQSAQVNEIARSVVAGECETGRGANQIGTLHRVGTTRWSSHFDSICDLINKYNATINVLENIITDGSSTSMRGEAGGSLIVMKYFDFIFILYLMHKIMAITDLLCRALQQKSLDIVNAMDLVSTTKALPLTLRNDGFDILLSYVKSFCTRLDIDIPDMSAHYKHSSRSCQQKDAITVEHHFNYDIFNATIDFQLEELNSRFSDETVELLMLSSALDPKDNFNRFNIDKICNLAEKYYPEDFTEQEIHNLRCQLQHYELDVVCHENFQKYPLSQNCVQERAFSAMKHVKIVLRNRMGEDFLTDSMIIYIEREFASSIDSDSIIDEYYTLKNRRAQLR
ncbi:zinc finger MYM-type protein 1-like [Zingiber officinale]|uniref:zinc finger MYM-type protein 1-like n=1 Tax=Zingiber officinale TaxID=94328 RepID=UPI001C4AA311|nr:zinc finger MYM-type protein 1-like [Zingiber officinale]